MVFKTVQWNIGGGKLLTKGADPFLLSSYREEGLPVIIELLRDLGPDIITLQETHASNGHSQPEEIANALGYVSWINDEWAESHVEEGQKLGQGIISKYPIINHDFAWFKNPNFEVVWENGTIAKSHDKGRTRSMVQLGVNKMLCVQTLHTIPFGRFNISTDSNEARAVLKDISQKLLTDEAGILQADFNIDEHSLRGVYPLLFENGFQEVV